MVTELDDLITVRQAARECKRTAETVRRWIWEGKVPAQKLGNQLFVRRADLAGRCDEARGDGAAERLAVLSQIRAVRERIEGRLGGVFDVLEAINRSRSVHPGA